MLLAIDVGNTNTTFGVMKGDKLLLTFRMTTKLPRTSDECGSFILEVLRLHKLNTRDVEDIIISSVVPQVMYSLTSGVIKYLKKEPVIVGIGTRTGIKIATGNPREIGADRIVDAVAGLNLYGGPIIVVDFGTATTYDLISEDGSFLAGITSPGIKICGVIQQNYLKLKLKNRIPFWRKIQSQVCRQDWFTVRSDRQNISFVKLKKKADCLI